MTNTSVAIDERLGSGCSRKIDEDVRAEHKVTTTWLSLCEPKDHERKRLFASWKRRPEQWLKMIRVWRPRDDVHEICLEWTQRNPSCVPKKVQNGTRRYKTVHDQHDCSLKMSTIFASNELNEIRRLRFSENCLYICPSLLYVYIKFGSASLATPHVY